MKKAKTYTNVIKRFYRPEMYTCLECHKTIKRAVTITERTVVTLNGIVRVTHGGYRCKNPECEAKGRTYRSAAADALVLPKRTFGLDVVLLIGYLRLKRHQTLDEVHEEISERLKEMETSISRREIMYLFDDFCTVMRAASDAAQDEEWKKQVEKNKGIIVSIDGIQPEKGNETIYIVRDALTGRMLASENATESSTERLKEILEPVVQLKLPVIGTISDSQSAEIQALLQLWPNAPHQACHFHVLRDAGQPIFDEDKQVKTEIRKNVQAKTRNLRKQIKSQMKQAGEAETKQLAVLDDYARAVQAAVNRDGTAPFDYAGIESFEELDKIAVSLGELDKKGEPVSKQCRRRLDRLKKILRIREAWRGQIESLKRMRQWVISAEHILDVSWAHPKTEEHAPVKRSHHPKGSRIQEQEKKTSGSPIQR
jgi:hypothetical protein